MDTYNLFADDGGGMLEGLTDLGGSDNFSGSTAPVAGENKDNADNSYRQQYSQNSVSQEGSIQKLASFGGPPSGLNNPAGGSGGGAPAPDYHEYGAYPPRPRMPQPHAPLHAPHHVHPSHYPGYHPGPDPMYAVPEQPGRLGDMGGWPGPPGGNRYTPVTPSYRHSYEHQQKMHQYPPQQGPGLGLQNQNSPYLPRQPHFPQPPSQQIYGQQQNYPNYTQMHPPGSSRINQHPTYHQQLDPHQYGLSHGQQSHAGLPQHQPHQNLSSHPSGISSGIQNHPNVHLHHPGAPSLHHVPRQSPVPPSTAPSHPGPNQMPYASAHHSVPMNYQPHQIQHPLDVNVSSQYNTVKPGGIETGSPQYRPQFPQLSPQMSPRAQISPRQQTQSQLSPRPVMSPIKGPIASPHGNTRNLIPPTPPTSVATTGPPAYTSQNTLQALEQMVVPTSAEYNYQRNPASPAVSHIPAPSQWSQNKILPPMSSALTPLESNEPPVKPKEIVTPVIPAKQELIKNVPLVANTEIKTNDQDIDVDKPNDTPPTFAHSIPVPKEVPPVLTPSENTSSPSNIQSNLPMLTVTENSDSIEKVPEIPTSETISDKPAKNEETPGPDNHDEDKSDHPADQMKEQPNQVAPTPIPPTAPKVDIPILPPIQPNSMNTQNQFENVGSLNINRSQPFPNNTTNSVPPVIPPSSVPASVMNMMHNNPASFQNTLGQSGSNIPTMPPVHKIQNITSAAPNTVVPSPPNMNTSNNVPCMPNAIPPVAVNIPANVNTASPLPTNMPIGPPSGPPGPPGASHPMAMPPMNVQNVHPGLQPNPNVMMPNMPHNINPGMMMMGNQMPHPNMPPNIYSTTHQQERMALQQQIQEIYCLPASNENQEKVRCLQDRLAMLQQHETNDKCTGGPNCILQNPVYGTKMVESPQVTSTTGRGRGKGPSKPRKPRAKKEKNLTQSLDHLPVSEDCVTAGTGIQSNSELDLEMGEDGTNLDSSALSLDEMGSGKVRKPRGPRKNKERKPRTPKEPKTLGDKPVKERKKREPKDPNTPRRKRNSKKDMSEFQADTTTTYDLLDGEGKELKTDVSLINNSSIADVSKNTSEQSLDESNVTDFDDIPVSKIAIKDLIEEAEAKRDLEDRDDDTDSPKKRGKKRSSTSGLKKLALKKPIGGRRKKRSGVIPDSDGEPDDMMSTPPPSPPPEADDSLKRRSARNTQRKKYTDDVMLRLSDEEFTMSTPKVDKEHKIEDINNETKDIVRLDSTPKPKYMYVNIMDDDAMIVQHVLAARMGKRELKELPVVPEPASTSENPNEEPMPDGTLSTEEIKQEHEIKQEQEIKQEHEMKQEQEIKEENEIKQEDEIKTEKTENESDEEEEEEEENDEKADDSKENVAIVQPPQTQQDCPYLDQDKNETKDKKPVMVDVEEYYVKYRNFSYLHCEWRTEEELYKGDKRIFSKIKRFKQKQAQQLNIFELLDEEPFNPDYIEVERILDMSETEDPANNTVVKHYLVKWKSLQYEDSTWELEENIDVDKIKQYKIFSEIPPKDKWRYKKKPCAEQWVQLKESPLYKGGNTLRPYQLEGLNWLLFSWHNNRNCILADEMGLGKTIQSLTFVNSVWEYGVRGPFLIIAPLSTIPNWQREFEGWTDMNVVVYHGSQQSKSMLQEYEFYYKNEHGEPIKEITKFNVLITTFEIIVTDFQELKSFNWRICVIDEAHRLKNRNCKLLEGLRQLHLEHRVLLSGTPLQNNVNELFSLLNFLEPSQFSSSDAFLNEFGQLRSESEVVKLQALLKPMMLRRLKEDVEKTLAPKEETIIEVELTNIQKKYYRAILERNFSFLQKGTASAANIPNLMNTMMELRKCCIHPYLLNGAEDQIQFDYKQSYGEDKEAYYKALIQSSGKMVLVDKLLPKLKAGGHRVLVFSQMVRCLDILEDYLVFRKYPYERIDGRIRGNLRQEAIDRFSKPDSDRFVFLLCTKAGGLGINLTAADTVIIYDSDWNPQNDLQAQARCHRIGQQKMVKIYRLICRNTYEREMFDKASLKLGLDKAILQSMNTSQGKETGLKQMSKKEIEDLLKKGAYGAVMDEDNAGDKFCEEDIEMILARRTQVIQMESEKGSTFSKASFAATDQRSDIDIRDPDFWNKWAKKAEIDTTEKKEDEDLIVTEPRKRTIIKRYGHDDGPMEMSDMEVTPDSDEDEEGISLRSKKKKDKFGKKGRKYASDDYIPRHEGVPVDEEVVYGLWTRSECFKIERGLLTFGWARWEEIVDKNQLRKGWTIPVIEDCARIIVLFCLRHYKGDEKIRNFIWDLIEPCENGEVTISRNHSGLHNPVPRGRNAKKKNRPKDVPKQSDVQKWEDPNHWSSTEKYDCDSYLEISYKKHLYRHANKVLLRVRMMYYIKHEVIGDYSTQIENGVHASALGMRVPRGVDSTPPRLWWDSECDVSLLVGTYIHGYENYLAMRSDPQLCFVDKLGPPDESECTDIKSEERKVLGSTVGDEECTDDVSSGAGATSPASPRDSEPERSHLWPSMQDLNTRLRRLITAYQRNYKREELKMQQKAKMERRERMDQLARDEMSQWRWSRADEEAFRRTVASYGVEFDPATKSLRWSRFRTLARLDSKSDDALTDYLKAFMAMCKRQCGLTVGEAELPTRADLKAEPIGEDRAIATLERIDLLRVLREEVAPHPALESRLALCEKSQDTPPWWQLARHDKLLILGVCKHGLGDTYNKIFCDPKLPFAECARKHYSSQSRSKNESPKGSDSEEPAGEERVASPRVALRRSRRTRDERDDDTDALSELETLAKLGRADEPPGPERWFTERALETRLHHIAHAVQNREWPAAPRDDERKQKRHIAIDVETDRAKLHALLSSPAADEPPPAHQRAAPAAAPLDLDAPLDLSEAQDFSVPRRADPEPAAPPAPAPRSKLDDTLSKLMKRKNVPAQEQIVGKEKKRKKLDEIVLGLSAAKGKNLSVTSTPEPPTRSRSSTILPDVTVTPAAPPTTSSSGMQSQKPFSVTVTNVPSPQASSKELSSFLQQSLEQTKNQKSSTITPLKSYSHEAKVNKWLAEQANVESRRRGPTPRLSPDEYVPVVHRVTGKRLVGHKAPQLKHLAQWIAENPLYDIDPKWTEAIKEHVKLPQDVRSQRQSPMQPSSSMGERKKGRPPTLDSQSSNVLTSGSHLNQSLSGLNPALLASLSSLSSFDPKTLASTLSNLTGFDPKLLNTFDPKLLSSLSSFDPKNNPLLSSFSSMPNLLGNIAGGNIFANLAGLGLPGFSSLDMNALSASNMPGDKSKNRKATETSNPSSSKSANAQFPFVFPNMIYPQLGLNALNPFGMHSGVSPTYDALGLLGPNIATSAGATSIQSASHSSGRSSSKTTTPRSSTVVSSSSASRQQKVSDRQQSSQMSQIHLPPDPYLLESLSKQAMSYDSMLRAEKRSRESEMMEAAATDLSKVDKKKPYDALRSQVPPEFAAVQEKLLKGDKKDIDISKMLLEQMASGALSASLVSSNEIKKIKESDKDTYEKLNKSSSEYIARTLTSDDRTSPLSLAHKRSHEEMSCEPENLALSSTELNPSKKIKESERDSASTHEKQTDHGSSTGEMDLEDLIAPSTVIKTGIKTNEFDQNIPKLSSTDTPTNLATNILEREDKLKQGNSKALPDDDLQLENDDDNLQTVDLTNKPEPESKCNDDDVIDASCDSSRKGKGRKTRKSSEDLTATCPRRELRSSAGRQSTDNII